MSVIDEDKEINENDFESNNEYIGNINKEDEQMQLQENHHILSKKLLIDYNINEDEIITHTIEQISEYRDTYKFNNIQFNIVYEIFLNNSLLGKMNKSQIFKSLNDLFTLIQEQELESGHKIEKYKVNNYKLTN